MLYEKQYMETLEKICHGYWNTETSSNINENKQTVKVIEWKSLMKNDVWNGWLQNKRWERKIEAR